MADGFTHSAATIGLATGIAVGYLSAYQVYPYEVPIIVGGCLAGLILAPDMDVDGGWIGHYWVRRVFGKIGELYFNGIVTPYQLSFRHRGFWSHFPIISTIVRLLFLAFPFIVLILRDQQDTPAADLLLRCSVSFFLLSPLYAIVVLFPPTPLQFGYFSAGLALSDILHYIFDILRFKA